MTKYVRDEIKYARNLKKKIIVVYDKDAGKYLNIPGVGEIEYNHKTDNPEKIIAGIKKFIHKPSPKPAKKRTASGKEDDALSAILLVGMGLLLLGSIASKSK